MTVWDFANRNLFPALLLLWAAAWMFNAALRTIFRMWSAWLRSRNIRAAGWPTAPIDADGDVVTEELAEQIAHQVIEKLKAERRRAEATGARHR